MPDITINSDWIVTLVLLIAEVALLVVCRIKLKRPIDPLRPRMIPYSALSMFLGLALLMTAAHIVSLATGHQLKPRIKGTPGGGPSPY